MEKSSETVCFLVGPHSSYLFSMFRYCVVFAFNRYIVSKFGCHLNKGLNKIDQCICFYINKHLNLSRGRLTKFPPVCYKQTCNDILSRGMWNLHTGNLNI